ncbi:flagellar hook protein FliD [Citrobacter sp. wls619]|uniref:flagellar filament capping protein FliD n=1 Tax=Citrobacter sp. wls619 TaxID=2576432 RepID=UPI0010C9BBED|nr:flagellar filament capping protein FliD [Citrobacter sp. wls619]TKV07865.1 flagellar hook protein FliD [Citrobacter sp. wls619]
MASFSMSGLGGSGLNIEDMIAQLSVAENKKLNPYLQKQSNYSGQTSSWGKISSALDAVKSNLTKLQDEGFNGVSIGTNKAFNATASKGAIPNSYSVEVEQLAKAHKVGTAAQANNDTQLGDGAGLRKVVISTGEGKPIEVELKDDETSLVQIAKKINAKNGDVTAAVMSAEGGKYQLVLTSKKTGEDGEISISVEGDDKLGKVLNYKQGSSEPISENSAREITPAKNAIISIDGTKMERSTNTITDAIEGITLELREVSEKDPDDATKFKPETLSVTADTSKVKSLIEEFVKVYNNYLNTAATASAYKEPEKGSGGQLAQMNPSNGALFGDGTLRRLTSEMKSAISGSYGDADDLLKSLGSIGISVKFEEAKPGEERSGTLGLLSIDSKKLDEALKNNPNDVEALFLGKGAGQSLKGALEDVFKNYLGDNDSIPKTEGTISTAIKGLKEQGSRVEKQISRMQERIQDSLDRSRKEFQRLDLAMTEMNNMSQQLQSALLGIMG